MLLFVGMELLIYVNGQNDNTNTFQLQPEKGRLNVGKGSFVLVIQEIISYKHHI